MERAIKPSVAMAMTVKVLLWAVVLIVPGGIVALPLLVRAYGGRERPPRYPLPAPTELLGPSQEAPASAHG
jgi:hypothetical protein